MGRSDKVSLWYVALLINTIFRFFLFQNKQLLSTFNVALRQLEELPNDSGRLSHYNNSTDKKQNGCCMLRSGAFCDFCFSLVLHLRHSKSEVFK